MLGHVNHSFRQIELLELILLELREISKKLD